MKDQEKYVDVLQKVIDATEKETIRSSEEIIQMLVYELSGNKSLT